MKYIVGILAIAIVGLGAFVLLKPSPAPISYGSAGADYYSFVQFLGGFGYGQGIIASSTSASVTLKGNEFLNADTLDYTINVGSVTLTFAASTTPICSGLTKGEKRDLFIKNATTTAASTLTIAGGTGINLLSASSSKAIPGSTSGVNTAKIVIQKLASSDCNALLTTFVP